MDNIYIAFCSQVQQSSQFIQSQTQGEGTQNQDDNEISDKSKKLDFQAAFIQYVGLAEQITPDNSKANSNVTVSGNFNSQTDFEALTHGTLIQNPHLADELNVNLHLISFSIRIKYYL